MSPKVSDRSTRAVLSEQSPNPNSHRMRQQKLLAMQPVCGNLAIGTTFGGRCEGCRAAFPRWVSKSFSIFSHRVVPSVP